MKFLNLRFQWPSEVSGTLWLGATVFLFLSLVSFSSLDPSWSTVGVRISSKNFCGIIGSSLSDILYQLFGWGSWSLVAFGLYNAVAYFSGRKNRGTPWVGLLALLLISSALVALVLPQSVVGGSQIPVGGSLGHFIALHIQKVANTYGGFLILTTLLLMGVFYVTGLNSDHFRLALHSVNKSLSWVLLVSSQLLSLIGAPRLAQRLTRSVVQWPIFRLLRGSRAPFEPLASDEPKMKVPTIFSNQAQPFENPNELPPKPHPFSKSAKVKKRKVKTNRPQPTRVANWRLPQLGMLEDPPESRYRMDKNEIQTKNQLLTAKLSQFSVRGQVVGAQPGPAVTMFEFKPEIDVKISKITELADDLSLALSAESVRIIAPIPGRDVVGIETSNSQRETVFLKDILADDQFWDEEIALPLALGREANGNPKIVDLRRMPHLLVAGTTGSGKSVFVVCALTGLLFRHSPETLRLILIDPKQVDLSTFNDIPHLLMPTICQPKKAVLALKWAVKEMEKRYRSMSKFGARGLEAFNEIAKGLSEEKRKEHEAYNEELENQRRHNETYYFTHQPYIVIVVEEFGDLMSVDKTNVEQLVVRLAQMARASGIHLILAMQSPRKDVVTGLIKTNIPGRISFKVASKMDSRIILDEAGGERLLARGDMLFLSPAVPKPLRHHGPWLTEKEIAQVMEFWGDQGKPEYEPSIMSALEKRGSEGMGGGGASLDFGESSDNYDDLYDEILAWVAESKSVSASLIQRKYRIGYPRAARLIETLEQEGVIGPANGSKPRKVLVQGYSDHP